LEYGYLGPIKSKIDNRIRHKLPSVDEMCIEKGYFKPSVKNKKKTSSVTSGELFGGSKSKRPKKTQRPKPKRPNPRKSKHT
jgi:hypothetical protein